MYVRRFLILAAVIFVVFGLAFWLPFNYDDIGYILNNPEVTGRWRGIGHALMTPVLNTGEYEALPVLFHRALYGICGARFFWYRLASLLLHGINVMLVLALYRRALGADILAFYAALLFAVYPTHSEIIAIASFNKHLFVSLFGLAMIFFQWHRRWPMTLRLGACWTCMVLALLSKESALILPILCLLMDMTVDKQGFKEAWRRDAVLYAGWGALDFIYTAWRIFVVPRHAAPLAGGSWPRNFLTAGKSFFWYLAHLPLPHGLCQEHTLTPVAAAVSLQGGFIIFGLAVLAWAGTRLWARDRILGLSLAWICLCLTPFLNIIPFANLSLVADRYMYLASAGLFLGLARLARFLRPRATFALTAIFFLVYAQTAMAHLIDYNSPLDLWSATVACAPSNPRGYLNLGSECIKLAMYDTAEKELDRALVLSQGDEYFAPEALSGLAVVYAHTGRIGQAISIAQAEALERPTAQAYNNLGAFRLQVGDAGRACADFEKAFAFGPAPDRLLINEALCQMRAGHLAKAETLLRSVPDASPLKFRAQARLGEVYARQRLTSQAEEAYEESLALDFSQPEAVKQLALLYARAGDPERGYQLHQRLNVEMAAHIEQAQAAASPNARELMRKALAEARHNEESYAMRFISRSSTARVPPRRSRK